MSSADPERRREVDCFGFAELVRQIADAATSKIDFMDRLARMFTSARNSSIDEMRNNSAGPGMVDTSDQGFKPELRESRNGALIDTHNQARHWVGGFIAVGRGGFLGAGFMQDREVPGSNDYASDTAMNKISAEHAEDFIGSAHGLDNLRGNLYRRIKVQVCGQKPPVM